jgi:tripartite-type tricarboxylate transporter receptor subunit TctC
MRNPNSAFSLATSALLLAFSCAGAAAQGYPEKAVTMVVPFPAGGAVDPVARTIANRMSEIWKQPVVILNRAGAGGNIGAESVTRAAPDGHTLLFSSTSLAIGPSLYAKLGFDVLRDLVPVSQVISSPNVLVTHPSVPARSIKQLVALAKARPGQLISASAGVGSSNHLSLLLFMNLSGTQLAHVPYKGAAPAVADTVGGHAHMTFAPIPASLALVQAGRLRALGVTSAKRAAALPDLPTIAETLPGYELNSWNGVLVPAGTPPAIVNRIHGTLMDCLRTPAVRDTLVKAGVEPLGNSPEEFAQSLRAELAKWGKIIRAAGIRPE